MNLSFASALARLTGFLFVFCAILPAVLAQSAVEERRTSPLPPPTGFVNDYVGVIDAATKQQLEERLQAFKDQTGVEIAVAVVRTTEGRDIFDYSLLVARGWGIGSQEQDNPGALLLVAIEDRKYFTQVSRDLEDELPDGVAGSLQRQFLVPEFRKGNYGKGISDTIDAYISTIEYKRTGEGTPPPAVPTSGTRDSDGRPTNFRVICCLAGAFLLLIFILANRGRRSDDDDDRWGGGSGLSGILPWIILSGATNALGSSSSSDSGWGGGSSWGGGSDWGGFGGGGDFGGGGAGGDW